MMRTRQLFTLVLWVAISFLVTSQPELGRGARGPSVEPKVYLPVAVGGREVAGTTLVSRHTNGTQGDDNSGEPAISADGRFVAFASGAANLAGGVRAAGIFIHDRLTRETTHVSRHTNGTPGDRSSGQPDISADGRFVTFDSLASNLVDGDTNLTSDVFVHDRLTGETTRVSRHTNGTQGNGFSGASSISADGRFVAFMSWAGNISDGDGQICTDHLGSYNCPDIFVHDRLTGQTTLVSRHTSGATGNEESFHPSISADGRFVAFSSEASNLVNDDTNGLSDVFAHDRQTGQTTRVSRPTHGTQGNGGSWHPEVSADGRFVAFSSYDDGLVGDDTDRIWDIFVHDRETGQTTLVSRHSDGTKGNGRSLVPSISADGGVVAFASEATNLVSGDLKAFSDIFVHDRRTGQTTLVSRHTNGTQGNNASLTPSASASGRLVAFTSYASNLVDGDVNGYSDVFVHDRGQAAEPHTERQFDHSRPAPV